MTMLSYIELKFILALHIESFSIILLPFTDIFSNTRSILDLLVRKIQFWPIALKKLVICLIKNSSPRSGNVTVFIHILIHITERSI